MSESVELRHRTLFLTCNAPRNTGSGGEIVSWRLLRGYAELGDVDVISLVPPGDRGTEELRSIAGRVSLIEVPHFYFANSRFKNAKRFLRSQVGSEPFRIAKTRVPKVEPLLREWLANGNYGLLHCDYLSTAPYRGLCPELPAVLAEHNVEWQTFSRLADQQSNPLVRLALLRDSRRTAEWEARALGRFQHTLVLSELDRSLLLEARPDLADRISVWPLPVETRERARAEEEQPFTVLVLGSLRSVGRLHGLRWFLREVWPKLRGMVPDARLEIVGADPPADICDRDSCDGVRVHGFVKDLGPILDRVDLCAIPLSVGAGIRVKVFELIGSGIPCVGSPVALQGIDWIDGCVRMEGGADDWIERLAEAAADRTALAKGAARGAAALRERHSSERATAHLREMIAGFS